MKKFTFLLLASLLFTGCASSSRMLQKGHYDAAVEKSVMKLRKNPSKKKEILNLERAYNIANERDLEQIRFMQREGDPRNMESIVQRYTRLKNRQSLVRTVLPLNLPDRSIQYAYVDYDQEIITARQGAAEFFYNNALQLIQRNDKDSYRQAWFELSKVREYSSRFPDVDRLMDEARYKGMSRALVSVNNHTHLNLPEEYTNALLTVDPRLDNQWVEFHFRDLDEQLHFDYFLQVNLRMIAVSPDRVSEKERMVRKQKEDGFEYVLDARGNVKKDSLGNDIKTPKFKTLACTVIETLQQKEVLIEGDLEIFSWNPQRLLKREPLGSTTRFEHQSARAVGDLEALEATDRKLIETKAMPFPTDPEMIMRSSELFRMAIASAIRQNRQLIR